MSALAFRVVIPARLRSTRLPGKMLADIGGKPMVARVAERAAESGALEGILGYSTEPLVSVDYIGNRASSTVDALSTAVLDGTLVHVSAWYDNEMGYSARCVDMIRHIGSQL